ncbi:MAG TPA: hypothetical protein VF091_03715 [Gaiellaceae bacterium]
MDWDAAAARAIARYEGGESRGLDQRQLTQLANAAWAAGLNLLMAGRSDDAATWLRLAAERYRESWQGAPPDSWGRPIAAMKSLLIAGADATDAAQWALDAGAAGSSSPIGIYAAALAQLVLREDDAAHATGAKLRGRDDFPPAVAGAVVAIAAGDHAAYRHASEELLADFEARADFLEDVPVADTVLALQRLAADRGVAIELRESPRLP